MSNLTVFTFDDWPVRTVAISSEPWFIAKDVCDVLGLNTNHLRDQLDSDEVSNLPITEVAQNGGRNPLIVSESGLYSLILRSRKPLAKTFKRWITHEVIPQIRRTGGYVPQGESPEETMARAIIIAQKTIANQTRQLEAQKPKVLFARAVESSKQSILIGELAKLLRQNGVDIGQNRLFKWMRKNGYLMSNNKPTQRSMDRGLFEIKETTITHASGYTTITLTPKVTGKGQVYFINSFLEGSTHD